jgi:hypothetical protein
MKISAKNFQAFRQFLGLKSSLLLDLRSKRPAAGGRGAGGHYFLVFFEDSPFGGAYGKY